MRNNKKTITILIAVLITMSSCAPIYVPNVINTPTINQKYDFQGNFNIGVSGFDPQLAYAFSDQFALMVNGSFYNYSNDSSVNFRSHYYGEAGIGYYKKMTKTFLVSVYAGAGFGHINTSYTSILFNSFANVMNNKIFISPSLGYNTEFLDFIFSPRTSYVRVFDPLGNSQSILFIEPALTLKYGFKYIKTVTQLGLSIPLINGEASFDYSPFIFSVGIQTNLNFSKILNH